MDIAAIIIIILIALLLVGSFYIIGTYNNLINARNKVYDKFYQIDNELKKRIDLIPSLLEVVQKHTKHEENLLKELNASKVKFKKSNNINNEINIYTDMTRSLNKVLSLINTYPDLNKDKAFQRISKALDENQDKINYAKVFYNDTVLDYNNKRQTFPSNIVAKLFKFKEIDYLK